MTEIRFATKDDIKDLALIHSTSWENAFKEIVYKEDLKMHTNVENVQGLYEAVLDNPKINVRIEHVDGKPHCIAAWSGRRDIESSEAAEIICIHSLPANWGKGYGTFMMNYLLQEIKQQGFKNIVIWVFEKNTRARKLYEKLGFIDSGLTRLNMGATELMYEKML